MAKKVARVEECDPVAELPHREITAGGVLEVRITELAKMEMSELLASSVQPSTIKAYNAHFKAWKSFLKAVVDLDDPYLRGVSEEDKTLLVGLMMLRRRQAGHRGK
jgi:hypothetical protein